MGQVRLALGVAAALAFGVSGVRAQNEVPGTAKAPTARPPDEATTASVVAPLHDPDAEVSYLPPRRVIAPPVYGEPGPPLNPGGVPYDELFASPYPFDLPSALAPPDDPYLD